MKKEEISFNHTFNCPFIESDDKETKVLAVFNLKISPNKPKTFHCYNEKDCKAMFHSRIDNRTIETITKPEMCYFYTKWQELNLPFEKK